MISCPTFRCSRQCIILTAAVFTWFVIYPEDFDPKEQIPDDAMLFRLQELPRLIIMRSDLRDLIESAKLTGLCLAPMGEQIW